MSAFLRKSRFEDLITALVADGQHDLAARVSAELDEQPGGTMACIYLPVAVIVGYAAIVLA